MRTRRKLQSRETGLKHGTDWETDRKTDRDKVQIQGLEQNLDQLCTHLARYFAAMNLLHLPSSERSVFMDTEPLVTEACSDASASDGEIRDQWNLPHVITITSSSESEEERHDDCQAVIYVDIF